MIELSHQAGSATGAAANIFAPATRCTLGNSPATPSGRRIDLLETATSSPASCCMLFFTRVGFAGHGSSDLDFLSLMPVSRRQRPISGLSTGLCPNRIIT